MGCIISLLFLLNYALWIVFDIICWYLTGITFGLIGLFGVIVFPITWALSGEATLSLRDFFRNTDFELFVIKLKWANSATLVSMFLFTLLFLVFDWCDVRKFLDITFNN